jgi:hypothetical protein
VNWYKQIKLADQFINLLSPEEKKKLSDMERTVLLYQNVINDLVQENETEELSDSGKNDIQNYQFFVDKVQKEIIEFKEWVLDSRSKDKKYDYLDKAIKLFGLTDDPSEAGYILPDGTMLDFSVKKEGGTPGRRVNDHREIGSILEGKNLGWTEGMNFLMKTTGSVRLGYNNDFMFVSFKGPLTELQIYTIIELGKERIKTIDIEGPIDYKTLQFPTGSEIKQAINELV